VPIEPIEFGDSTADRPSIGAHVVTIGPMLAMENHVVEFLERADCVPLDASTRVASISL